MNLIMHPSPLQARTLFFIPPANLNMKLTISLSTQFLYYRYYFASWHSLRPIPNSRAFNEVNHHSSTVSNWESNCNWKL